VTEVNLVVKVIDKITEETKKIVGRFREQMKRAAAATKDFFKNFDVAVFGAVFKGLEKMGKAIGALSAKIVELAPNAQVFEATFGPATLEKINATASGINKVGAAWDQFVGNLVNRGPNAVGILDELSSRLKAAAGLGPALTERAKLQVAIVDAEERFANSVSRERGEYTRLKGEIEAAKNALVAYDEAQRKRAEAMDLAAYRKEQQEFKTTRERVTASGGTLLDVPKTLDRYGRPIDQAAADIRELQRISGEAFQIQVENDLAAWVEYNEERVRVTADALDDISEEELDFIATMQRIRDEDVQQQIADQEKIAQAARDRLDQSFEEHRRNMEAMAELDRQRIEKAAEEMQKLQDDIDRLSSVITDNFMAAFDSIILGTESVGRAFTRMVGSILADVGRMMAAEAMKKFISGVLGSLFGGAPSYSTQNGGAFDAFGGEISPLYDTLPGQASGGFVPGRSAFMVGERGPELFVPPSSGNIITAARSGGNSVSGVTINVNGAQDPGRTAREVKAALMSLMSSDPAARQRLRVVASGGGVA